MLLPLFSLLLLHRATALLSISFGQCPANVRGEKEKRLFLVQYFIILPGLENFDKAAFLGQWYEYSNMFEIYQDVFAGTLPVTVTVTVNVNDNVNVMVLICCEE